MIEEIYIKRSMILKTTKGDIIWNYAGSIFNIGMSVFILPFVLRTLSSEELGLWYIFGSIAALVSLLDFGFSPSIMRNILYAWSGATRLYKEGIPETNKDGIPNYSLVEALITASKRIYLGIALLAGLVLLFVGTPYIKSVIASEPSNYLTAWGIYSVGVFFNLYYSYWNPLLKGIGAIKIANQVQVFSRLIYMIFTILGLYFGGGLIWLSIMYVISGVLLRIFSKRSFEKISNLDNYRTNNTKSVKVSELLEIIWPNAKKQGLVTIGAWLITRSTTLLCSHFYGLTVTAEFGLTLQLYGFIGGFSGLLFNSYVPEITSSKLKKDTARFRTLFARSMLIQWIFGILGILGVVYIAPILLQLIGSNSTLLPRSVLIVLGIILFLEWNHSTFASLITLSNKVPFLASSLFSGIGIIILSLITEKFTNLGVLGLVLSQGVVQILYNNWYWPRYVFKENDLSLTELLKAGVNDINKLFKEYFSKIGGN